MLMEDSIVAPQFPAAFANRERPKPAVSSTLSRRPKKREVQGVTPCPPATAKAGAGRRFPESFTPKQQAS